MLRIARISTYSAQIRGQLAPGAAYVQWAATSDAAMLHGD